MEMERLQGDGLDEIEVAGIWGIGTCGDSRIPACVTWFSGGFLPGESNFIQAYVCRSSADLKD